MAHSFQGLTCGMKRLWFLLLNLDVKFAVFCKDALLNFLVFILLARHGYCESKVSN